MQVWRSLGEVPTPAPGAPGSVVTIGVFDGVHRGHRAVVGRAADVARDRGARCVVLTFDPHPMRVVRPEHAPPAITSLDHRVQLLGAAGADAVLVLPFDRETAAQSAGDFVREVLVRRLRAVAVVVGEDFRFGHRAAGDVALLRRLGEELGFEVVTVAPVGGRSRWSSTYVRERVAAGDVSAAAEALGHPVRIEGVVVAGDRRGHGLGYPTANVPVPDGMVVPADGVYAGWLVRTDADGPVRLPAAVSVGTNPTFGGTEHRVEAYVLDRDDLELYGVAVAVELVEHIRGMERFDGVEALVARMADDVERARELLSQDPAGATGP
ncbi:MAG TPA: bifunctional riboflavin kinase/FAD synthetase [Jiangellales bacterium]|nr:bifunctional riboflavin kinase/FAD synthetase [Jiangellales bacterium]